jgi:DNA (cytosine-5)-methyltransferase 1
MAEPISPEMKLGLKSPQETLYSELKYRYFYLMSHTKLKKGRLRAFIAASVQLTEWSTSGGNIPDDSAHIDGLKGALDLAEKIGDQSELDSRLAAARDIWREGHRANALDVYDQIEQGGGQTGDTQSPYRENNGRYDAISLFSGAMGLDIGFIEAGFRILVANDIDAVCSRAASENIPELKFINRDINEIPPGILMNEAGLEPGGIDLLIGGPPCQPFSPAGRRAGLNDPRASPLIYFIRAIVDIRPRAFVMEEVPGILSSRIKHFPYYDKYKRTPSPEEERGSAFRVIMEMLHSTGYNIEHRVLNAADYGTPQVRNRVVFIGLRDGQPSFPPPEYSGDGDRALLPWNTLWDSVRGLRGTADARLAGKTAEYMGYVPPGGNWVDLPVQIAREAMRGGYDSEGGRMGFFRRLAWDEPSPTLVTSPTQKGTYLVHPELDRPLSVAEYKRLQGFPDDWTIPGNTSDRYRLIGNAVPVYLSRAVAYHIRKLLEGGY